MGANHDTGIAFAQELTRSRRQRHPARHNVTAGTPAARHKPSPAVITHCANGNLASSGPVESGPTLLSPLVAPRVLPDGRRFGAFIRFAFRGHAVPSQPKSCGRAGWRTQRQTRYRIAGRDGGTGIRRSGGWDDSLIMRSGSLGDGSDLGCGDRGYWRLRDDLDGLSHNGFRDRRRRRHGRNRRRDKWNRR
jgi:hypothetical protein